MYLLAERNRRNTRISRIIQRIFQGYPGNIAVQLWDGTTLDFGSGAPDVSLIFHDPHLFRDLILYRDPLRLAEAYFNGGLEIQGDLYKALELKDHLQSLTFSASEKVNYLLTALTLGGKSSGGNGTTVAKSHSGISRLLHRHSKTSDSKAIAFHYDVSNEFYKIWLDEQMVYSCAYFESAEDGLDRAQQNKMEHLCRKLRLRSGEKLLDIGCGWGALICWAARHHGVHAHGITLSHEQYEYCQMKIKQAGLEDKVTVELKDYRDLQGEARYDKIVSVGMFEHVGLKNLPHYFDIARRLLKPGGLFLNHGITHDREGWGKSLSTRFINRYVFPDGELDTVSNVQRAMEGVGYEILDVESLRSHYAMTLRHWVKRLEARKTEALKLVPRSAYRVWRLYMAACALQFEEGGIGVYQILAASKSNGLNSVPLTRRDLYAVD